MSDTIEPGPEEADEHGVSLLDRLRGTGVGVEDPNIVGDVGPTDIPPGRDPDSDGLFADAPVELSMAPVADPPVELPTAD
jgi:hypothetical protein